MEILLDQAKPITLLEGNDHRSKPPNPVSGALCGRETLNATTPRGHFRIRSHAGRVLSEDQRTMLMHAADNCPVRRTLLKKLSFRPCGSRAILGAPRSPHFRPTASPASGSSCARLAQGHFALLIWN